MRRQRPCRRKGRGTPRKATDNIVHPGGASALGLARPPGTNRFLKDLTKVEIMKRSRKDRGAGNRLPPLTCGLHGEQRDIAVICRHLADAESKVDYRWVGGSDAPYREIAWCARCEEIRKKAGGWTWEAVTGAELKLVCLPCYREHLARDNVSLEAPPE
jgi:hypothetical protein